MKLRSLHIFGIIWMLVFLCAALPRLSGLMGQDEISHYFKICRLLWEKGFSAPEDLIVFSPHGYPLLVSAFCQLLWHFSPEIVKLAGVFMWLVCLAVLAFREHSTWKPATLLVATVPAVAQAAVTVEIDQTLLPLTCLAAFLAYSKLVREESKTAWFAATFAMTAAFWTRLTTPFLLWPAIGVFVLFFKKTGRFPRLAKVLASLLSSFLVFLVTWYFYCRFTGVGFSGPFEYLYVSFLETSVGSRASGLSRIAQTSTYLCFWGLNPLLAMIFLWDGWRKMLHFRRTGEMGEAQAAWLAAAVIFAGYLFVGGSLFGFPKYHCPAFPLMGLALASSLPAPGKRAGLIAVAALLVFAVLKDPLHLLRVDMKIAFLHYSGIFPLCMSLLSRVLFVAVVFAWAILVFGRKQHWKQAVFCLIIGTNLGFSLRQCTAGYCTGYIYGDKGECMELANIIRDNKWENRPLYVPVEVVHLLGLYDTAASHPLDWDKGDDMADFIARDEPPVVAVSYLINILGDYRNIQYNEKLQDYLCKHYTAKDIGHLKVWLRKNEYSAN